MVAPLIIANGGTPGVKASVAATSLVTLALDSLVGVRTIQWQILSTDETHSIGDYPLTITGSIGQFAEFTSAEEGTAVIVRVMINNGLVRGVFTPSQTVATIKIYVPTGDVLEVGATGEQYESDPEHGTTGILNQQIRRLGTFVSGSWASSSPRARASSTTNLVLSGDPSPVDGATLATGDLILLLGQTAPAENGLWTIDTGGAWTRPDFFSTSPGVVGSTILVIEGSVRGGFVYQNTNTGTIVVGTTALTFARTADRFDRADLAASSNDGDPNQLARYDAAAVLTAAALRSTQPLPATAGLVRASSGFVAVAFRNAADTGNIDALSTSSDEIVVGDATAESVVLRVATSKRARVDVATDPILYAGAAGLEFGRLAAATIAHEIKPSSAGTDMSLSAQSGDAGFSGGSFVASSGEPGTDGVGTAGDVVLDAKKSGDVSGRWILRAGSFGDKLTISYNNSTSQIDVDYDTSARVEVLAGSHAIVGLTTTESVADTNVLFQENEGISLGLRASTFGGGERLVFVSNRATAPTSNPADGGFLYAEAGAGKWRGSSGTVTTFGPAEPHCPRCGRDFAHEWINSRTNEELSVCVPCMIEALERAGVDVSFAFVRKFV